MTLPDTIHPALRAALARKGYETLTDVQGAVLAEDAFGQDLLVSAQTGSGKTVAFGIAMAPDLLGEDEKLPFSQSPLALVIAPTRELALQVQRELTWLYADAGARIASAVGGMDPRAERRAMERGAHIIVGTPGRLKDHIERGALDLSAIRAIVLDEADEMLDFGFREDLEFILGSAPEERRTLLFSATVSKEIARIAQTYQSDAVRISTISHGSQHADISYVVHAVPPRDRENAVINVLRYHGAPRALVFCGTREGVNRMAARLANRGFASVALSGELSQAERTKALQSLRDGRAAVCVATDVAARGIDLPGLDLVIHADLPNNSETLLHRSGRTGRAGAKGISVLVTGFNQRGRATRLLRDARLDAEWSDAPDAEAVRAKDRERLGEHPAFAGEIDEDRLSEAREIIERFGAERVALGFLAELERRLPAPEELGVDSGPVRREERAPRDRNEPFERRERRERTPRAGFEGSVWFEVDMGRRQRAEPRWLVPMICRLGDVTGRDIGAIDIGEVATRFEITGAQVEHFEKSLLEPRERDQNVVVRRAGDTPLQPANPDAPPARQRPPRDDRPGRRERFARKTEREEDALYEDKPPAPSVNIKPLGQGKKPDGAHKGPHKGGKSFKGDKPFRKDKPAGGEKPFHAGKPGKDGKPQAGKKPYKGDGPSGGDQTLKRIKRKPRKDS
ncbi:cold-shock dead-box protein A [Glycocaulis alkaliphilus]|uniref:Cold-shock dead-box protein A n=1 Tax=Glycocaulis alkaliphilus TaxID=1434191 RepID=A0A3T0E5B4_9PROT|nr:DEAD/DEAH box helicase [Glycocaulis alkaliphilus]AZU02561.1 cold-shock dead-box protein A [Glycocaulis alkaliphilus]GGB80742.1 DEAD/DEAH box helicase [Glycocaulis alkaliphilus]